MYDYYRVRFKEILPSRRPIGVPSLESKVDAPIPLLLKPIYAASALSMFLGLVVALIAGKSSLESIPHGLGMLVLSLPVTAPIALGFQLRQRWTRSFMVAVAAFAAGLTAAYGSAMSAVALGLAALLAAAYLYRWPSCREYYRSLRDDEPIRIELADLRSASFIPVYTALLALAIGAVLGSRLFDAIGRRGLLDLDDWTGWVMFVVLGAGLAGSVGNRVGREILRRRTKHQAR